MQWDSTVHKKHIATGRAGEVQAQEPVALQRADDLLDIATEVETEHRIAVKLDSDLSNGTERGARKAPQDHHLSALRCPS